MDSRFDGSLLAGSWDRFEHPAPDIFGAEVVTRRLLGASTVGAGSEERTPAQPEPELPEDQQVTEGTAPGTELIDNESLGQESGTDSMTHATSGESCERTPRQAQRLAEMDIATAVLSMRSLADEFSKLRRDMEQLFRMRIRMPDGRLRSLPADGHEIEALQNGGAGMEMQECQALVRRIRLSTEESWHQEVMMVHGAAQQRGNRSFHQWW